MDVLVGSALSRQDVYHLIRFYTHVDQFNRGLSEVDRLQKAAVDPNLAIEEQKKSLERETKRLQKKAADMRSPDSKFFTPAVSAIRNRFEQVGGRIVDTNAGLRISEASNAVNPQHLERYVEHARRLQTWIGAFGVGLAALLVAQMRTSLSEIRAIDPSLVGTLLVEAQGKVEIAAATVRGALADALIYVGAALGVQVLLLLINKTTQLEVAHNSEIKDDSKRWTKLAHRISDWAWIDLVIDLISIVLLAIATYIGIVGVVLTH